MALPNNITELRHQVLEAMEEAKKDPRRIPQAEVAINGAGKVTNTLKMEFEYAIARGEEPDIPFMGKTSGKPLRRLRERVTIAAQPA